MIVGVVKSLPSECVLLEGGYPMVLGAGSCTVNPLIRQP